MNFKKKWKKTVKQGIEKFGIFPSSRQLDIMAIHGLELIKWNKKFNITSITDPLEVAIKHFIDSAVLGCYVPDNIKILDIGSGGGFPGIPLKVIKPLNKVVMIDASRKKTSFLKHIIRTTNITEINAFHGRAQDFAKKQDFKESFDIVVSRAFTSLKKFLPIACLFLSKNGFILAMKGSNWGKKEENIKNFQKGNFDMSIYKYTLSLGNYDRCIIKIKPLI